MKRLFLEILFCSVLVLLTACSGGPGSDDGNSSDKGSIVFSLVWKGGTSEEVTLLPLRANCSDIGVATVSVDVYDGSGNLASNGGPWPCEDHSGTISEIEPGDNYTVESFGMDGSGDVLYQGSKTGITVTAGETTNAGEIVLEFAWPTVNITGPEDGSMYQHGDTISFSSTWSDFQDGTLPVDSLVWTSSLDGQIGTGTSFSRDDLSIGTHTITFTVTDSDGATGTDTISIIVRAWREAAQISLIESDAWTPQVAMDNNGDAIITWCQIDGSGYEQIYKAEYRNGGPWEFPADLTDNISFINNPYQTDATYPMVAMNDNGDAIISWNQEIEVSETYSRHLYMTEYMYDDTWTSPGPISGAYAASPRVAMGNNENCIIGWEQYSKTEHFIYFTESRGGGSWADSKRINISPEAAYDPQVAVNDNGNGILVWNEYTHAVKTDQVLFIEYRNDGLWTTASSISLSGTYARSPHVALSNGNQGNGDGIITWQQSDGDYIRIYYVEYRDGGDWTTPSIISPSGTDALNPQVAINDNGDAILMWEQKDDTGHRRISYSEYRNGSGWSSPSDISLSGADARYPQVVLANNGDAIITWCQYDDADNSRIYMSGYRNGDGWSTPSGISSGGSPAYAPQVAMNDIGNAIITWQQSDGDDYWIYMREFY